MPNPKPLFAKQRQRFPDPSVTLEDGLLDVSDDLSVETLVEAYSFGIFPWPQEGLPTLWFSPPERGILELNQYKPSTKFQKFLNKCDWSYRFNSNFETVIQKCQKAPRPGQDGTWITGKILEAYLKFHQAGYAHSIECYDRQQQLIGGLYGVYVGGVFCGESMYYDVDNASKFCLHHLVQTLKAQSQQWMDIQMVTPYLESVGAHYISRSEFLQKLEESKKTARPINFQNLG